MMKRGQRNISHLGRRLRNWKPKNTTNHTERTHHPMSKIAAKEEKKETVSETDHPEMHTIKKAAGVLHTLLSDPQPGLFSWNSALMDAMKNMQLSLHAVGCTSKACGIKTEWPDGWKSEEVAG